MSLFDAQAALGKRATIIGEGCKVMHRDPLGGSTGAYVVGKRVAPLDGDNEEYVQLLSVQTGSVVFSRASYKNMWHIGDNHNNCLGKDNKQCQ